MNNLKKHYDLNNYNFYENNKLFKLEFNLEDVIIYELIAGGYIKNDIANNILKKYIDEINISIELRDDIKKYINNSNKIYGAKKIDIQLEYNLQKYENEIKIDTFVTEYIKSNSKYVKDFSLWVDLEKLKQQAKDDIVREFQLYDIDRKINNINNINKLKYNNNNIIKIYLSLTHNFIGLMTIIITKKLFLFNFLNGSCIPKEENNVIITINKNIISLNEQKYELIINDNNLDNPILSDFFYSYEINLEENKFLFNFKCVWKNIFYINFLKLATLYSEKVKNIDNNLYSKKLTLLLNSKLNNNLRDKLYYIIKNIVDKIDNQSDLNNLNEKLDYINDYLLDNEKLYNYLKIIPIKKDETKQIYFDMNDLLSVKGKEIIIYEKNDLKKYIIYFLLGYNKYTKNNSNVNNIYNNINNNFGKYFYIDKIIKQINIDYYRGIGFTYNNISIILSTITPKEKIVKFKDILNKDNKISKKILNFVNTFINFVLEDSYQYYDNEYKDDYYRETDYNPNN
jgi:hypothetical protein